jgi:hypothetical protein
MALLTRPKNGKKRLPLIQAHILSLSPWLASSYGYFMEERELVDRLLAQNDRLIAALVASSPVEVIKALNPTPAPLSAPQMPWGDDEPKTIPEDPWGDPRYRTDDLLSAGPRAPEDAWVDPPFVPVEVSDAGSPEA